MADPKNVFFWHRTKTSKKANTINALAPLARKLSQKQDFWPPFSHRFFDFFKNLQKHVWSLQFHTFNGFRPSKTSHFPIKISLIFYVFSKPLPGTVFRGSRRRSCLHRAVLVPFSIFGISKKAPFGRHFRANVVKKLNFFPPERSLNRPCFSLNHSNYAAVGPYWILKRRF